jgi:hypothetical protein
VEHDGVLVLFVVLLCHFGQNVLSDGLPVAEFQDVLVFLDLDEDVPVSELPQEVLVAEVAELKVVSVILAPQEVEFVVIADQLEGLEPYLVGLDEDGQAVGLLLFLELSPIFVDESETVVLELFAF